MERQKSKITKPVTGAAPKFSLQAFRADRELTQLLNSLPNKSEFITQALLEKFGSEHTITCPTCSGIGKVVRNRAK